MPYSKVILQNHVKRDGLLVTNFDIKQLDTEKKTNMQKIEQNNYEK